MMVADDANEEIVHTGEDEDDEEQHNSYTIQEVVQAGTSRRSRRGAKQQQNHQQIVYMKTTNENGEEDEEGTTIYIQSEDVEEEMGSDGMAQYINGSVVTSEAGEQYIISTSAESGDLHATPIMIELKKEHNDDEHFVVTPQEEGEHGPE